MTLGKPDNKTPPPPKARHGVVVWSLIGVAILIHCYVCDWGVKAPGPEFTTLVQIPNLTRHLAGRGPRYIQLYVDKNMNGIVAAGAGIAVPVILMAIAGYLRFNATEFKQIGGALACVLGGFVVVAFLLWVSQFL